MNKPKRILELIQILYQNEEIDNERKNKISILLPKARKNNDFSELHKQFKTLSYGTTMPEIVEELLQLTN